MKNFIWVINKEKIYAYVLSILTVVILFVMSTMINKNLDNSELTSTNVVENTQQTNEENKIENLGTAETTINDIVSND